MPLLKNIFPSSGEISNHNRGRVIWQFQYLAEATKPRSRPSLVLGIYFSYRQRSGNLPRSIQQGKAATLQHIPAEPQLYHEAFQLRWRQTSTRVLKI